MDEWVCARFASKIRLHTSFAVSNTAVGCGSGTQYVLRADRRRHAGSRLLGFDDVYAAFTAAVAAAAAAEAVAVAAVAVVTTAAVALDAVAMTAHECHRLVAQLVFVVVVMVVMVVVGMMMVAGGCRGVGVARPPPSYRQQYVRAVHATVHAHVPVQVAGLREPEQAQLALVRLFARVYPQVFGERGRVAERFLAQPAPVRSLARVGAHVRGDGRRLREPAIAYLAPERFFAGMRAHVCRQVGRLAERFVAIVAPVRLFTRVRAQVGLQRAGSRVRLAAYPAQVRPATVIAHGRGGRADRRTVHPDAAADSAARGHKDFGAGFPILAIVVDRHR